MVSLYRKCRDGRERSPKEPPREIRQEIYNDCEDYKGTNSETCKNIQRNDITYKCVFDGTCKNEKKLCSDAKYKTECNSITPTDTTNKQCAFIFYNNYYQCVEQYKTCELYASSGETIDQNKCESIVLEDSKSKCTYSSNTCKTETKKCSDFKLELLQSSCYYLTPNDDTKKCTYSSNACTTTDKKTCLELFGSKDATKEICEAASTTSDKRSCALSSTGNGCEEVNKQNDNKSFAGKGMHLSKILFVLICLML